MVFRSLDGINSCARPVVEDTRQIQDSLLTYVGWPLRVEPKIEGTTIVLNGEFTPTMFTPDWLRRVDVIDDDMLEGTTTEVVNQGGTILDLDKFKIQVLPGQMSIDTTQAPFVRIADFAAQLFKEILPHSPIKQLGINYIAHFDAGSAAKRHKIGRTLAPMEPWGEWGASLERQESKAPGGLLDLTVQKPMPDRDGAGYTQVQVQPSSQTFTSGGGVYLLINNHYEIRESVPTAQVCRILAKSFDTDIFESRSLLEHVYGLGQL